jgi:hypothetical protein
MEDELVGRGFLKTVGGNLIRTIDLAQFEVGFVEPLSSEDATTQQAPTIYVVKAYEEWLMTQRGKSMRALEDKIRVCKVGISKLGHYRLHELNG